MPGDEPPPRDDDAPRSTDDATDGTALDRRSVLRATATGLSLGAGVSAATSPAAAAAPGDRRWAVETGGNVRSSPTVVDGTVYVGSEDGNLYALDAADGSERWRYETAGPVYASPRVADGTVYVGSRDDVLYALDAADGTREWAAPTRGAVDSSPAVGDGTVYVGSNDGGVYAVDASDGTERWRFETGDGVRTSPAVVDGTVYVGSYDDTLYALDADSGTERWRVTADDWFGASPAVADGTVYAGSHDTNVYAVDAEDGTERWRYELPGAVRITAAPTVHDGTVYVSASTAADRFDNLYAIDATDGAPRWGFSMGRFVYSAPTVVDDTVYVGGRDRTVRAVDAAAGVERWRHETDGEVFASPTVVAGTLYVGSDDGRVYAIETAGGSSQDSRVRRGTLGHHYAAAGRDGPASTPGSAPEVDVTTTDTATRGGETVTLAVEVTNTGDAPIDADEIYVWVDWLGSAEDAYPDDWDLGERTVTDGEFARSLWGNFSLSPGESAGATVALEPPATADGEYEFEWRVTPTDDETRTLASDVATVDVVRTPPNRVRRRDGQPIADAEVDLYVTDLSVPDLDDGDPPERHVATATTDDEGVYELPTTFEDGDRELLVTARKADWFTVERYAPSDVDAPSDYGELTLDRQLLYGPRAVQTDDGAPFGAVSVWRHLVGGDFEVFYTEVTNTNENAGADAWRISGPETPGGGPSGGDFLFAFPEDAASVAEAGQFYDPTGDGGVHVFGRGQAETAGQSLAETLHPFREYADVPLYAAMRSQPSEAGQPSWHTITPASSERAERAQERLRDGLELPGKLCSKLFGVTCGPGILLEVLDTLVLFTKILDGDRRIASTDLSPTTPPADGAVVNGVFDAWEADDLSLDTVSTQSAVAYQVPVRVDGDAPVTYTVRTEWARPFYDLGEFSGTFTTAAIDVELPSPGEPLGPGETGYVDVRLVNRSLDTRTITEVIVETPDGTTTLTPDVDLAPGERTIVGGPQLRVPDDGADEVRLTATATADDGTTVARIGAFDPETGETAAEVRDDATTTTTVRGTTATTTGDDTTVTPDSGTDADVELDDGGESVPGFGVLGTLAAGGAALANRLRGGETSDEAGESGE